MKEDLEFTMLYLGFQDDEEIFKSEQLYNSEWLYTKREECREKVKTKHFLLQLFDLLILKTRRH